MVQEWLRALDQTGEVKVASPLKGPGQLGGRDDRDDLQVDVLEMASQLHPSAGGHDRLLNETHNMLRFSPVAHGEQIQRGLEHERDPVPAASDTAQPVVVLCKNRDQRLSDTHEIREVVLRGIVPARMSFVILKSETTYELKTGFPAFVKT